MAKPFSTFKIERGDAFTPDERKQIAANIIEFAECAWCETTRNHFGVLVVERKRLTMDQMKWLGAIHDDVLGRIKHH